MKSEKGVVFVTRDSIMKLLSATEVARLGDADAARLADGDEYIDLTQFGRGVQRAHGTGPALGKVFCHGAR
jgi:hypothetical protein